MPNGDPDFSPWAGPGRIRSELTVPLTSLVSRDDIEHARGLLAVHQPRAVIRRVCSACGEEWPCLDARYGWAVTGGAPQGPLPGVDPAGA
jgi:hypothetical protein